MRGSNRRSGIDMGGCFLPMMVSVSSAARTAAVHAHVPYGGWRPGHLGGQHAQHAL